MKFSLSIFRKGFNSSKCKTMGKMATARIKLLRNKREIVVRQMRRDVAVLLQSGQDSTARIRVEHVIREQNIMAANEIIDLFCELIVARVSIISKRRECPADLKEGISSLIFAAPRCADIPELLSIRDIFEKKYGKDFVSAATELRPDCGVNHTLIDKLSVRTPSGAVKLKVMKEIAKEHQIDWDATETEMELLKPPEEHLEGPRTFVSASSMPVNRSTSPMNSDGPTAAAPYDRSSSCVGERTAMHFNDTASAAEAAAESAKKAVAAAQAAAYLASIGNTRKTNQGFETSASKTDYDEPKISRSAFESRSFSDKTRPTAEEGRKVYRRHSYNVPLTTRSDIKFDESDCDEEDGSEVEGVVPPNRPPPPVPRCHVHPKLPDCDAFSAHFEALKFSKPRT